MATRPIEFELDETKPESLREMPAECDWLSVLQKKGGDPVDAVALLGRLRDAPRAASIRTLQILPTSQLTDLRIATALPHLDALFVQGARIETLDGIESFRGRVVEINTGKNKRRRLGALAGARLQGRLTVLYAHPSDMVAIGACHSLGDLVIAHAPAIDFETLKNLRIESLQVNNCSIVALEDIAKIETLEKLSVLHCRRLERFAGDCGNVRWAMIDASKVFDLRTMAALSGVEFLTLTLAAPAPISTFFPLQRLKSARFWAKPLALDDRAIRRALPDLEKLEFRAGSADVARSLSADNPGLLVTTENVSFLNGAPAKRQGEMP